MATLSTYFVSYRAKVSHKRALMSSTQVVLDFVIKKQPWLLEILTSMNCNSSFQVTMKLAEIGLTGTDLSYTDLINTDPLDDNLIEILDSSIETGDFSTFFDILKSENSYLKLLYGIYSKINNYVSKFCHDLYSSQILVANALQLLTELIQVYGIREIQCLKLSRTILSLIIDEHCSINNIKRAVNVLNSLVKKQSVISSLIQDDRLEGSLQIFGRKIPEIGDYECQALLYEALYRITCDKNREYWANVWFLDPVAKNMFLSLDPGRFETNCRAALNYINRNELDRRVFSVIAYCVSFGSFELKQPSGSEFWIDFNYGSQSISFYCSELSVNDSLNDSDLWETILINNPSVTSYYIEENEAEKVKVVTLILNCPCQNLMTCSVISNPAFNSFEIKLSFRGLYDVYTHLEAIYGRALSCEIFSKRKISDSCLILIKTEENEDVIPETEEAQPLARIFESSEPLKIPQAVNVLNSLVKKQSVISSLIQDDRLEGSLQIFGRKIPEIGDYECQALLYEALYRITCDKNREYWANVWFLDPVAKNMFLSLDPGRFETNCRAALNYINRNELDRRVFSVIAYCVSFGSFELKQPSGSEFWIDFNYGSQSISFYCSELSVNDSLNDSDLWETILINNPSVTSYYIEENEAEKVKVVTLILNCPCQNLMTCSVISNPAFNSFEIKLSFRGLYDVYTHLEAIYGREKFRIGPLPKKPKVSDCTDVIKCSDIFENGTAEALSCEIFSKRKISDSCLILIKTEENEDVIPETEEAQPLARIFESSEPLKIPQVEHIENIQYETHLAKKIYNSEPIPLTSIPEIEAFQDSNVPPRFSEIINSAKRKVSCCSVNIKINDDYEHQVIECQERQKDEQTMSQGKKAKLTNSSSLDNNSSATLVKGIIDKTRSNTELQSNLKSCTNTICTSKYGKKDFSEENVDSYSAGIYDKKEAIDSVNKNKTKVNGYSDERNSVTSDVFSDVSMIEDSQTKTHGSVEKSEHYLRNRLKRPSSVPLQLSTAPKEKVLRRTSSMPAAYDSNGFHESAEDDYEIIPCSKNIKLSMPDSEKNEGQERQSNVEKKRKKRRTRRRSRRISDRKISQTSKTSSSSPDNINIKNSKPLEDKKKSANEERQKKVCNMKEQIRKPINSVNIPTDNNISTSEMHRNDNPSQRKHYSDLNHTLNLTDRNSCEKIQKEMSDESCVILDENVIVVEDSFNEKRYPEKSMQEEENKSSSSSKKTSEEKSVHLSPAVCLQNQEGTTLTCIEKITKNDGKKSPSEKPKTHSVPNITSSKSEEDDSKVCGINNESQVPYKESGESSKGTTNSESAPKKQPPKKRLYNLDNAPVFDVPPSKFSNKSPKRGFSDHPVWNLNTDEQDNFEDNRVPNCDRKNVSNMNKNNNLRISDDKLKIYDTIAESDEDFQEHNNRDLNETRKRSRTMPQRKISSKKKKTEVSQSDKIVKSTRTRREAAVKAMKVNKRILDPAPEVACDEIKVMGESDDSPENTAHKPEKKRKYSKVFGSSRHSSTETGSSEVSWLKKPCRLFESPKRSYSQWKKTLKKKSLPVKNLPAKSLPAKSLPAKSLPAKSLPAKSLPAKSLPIKVVSASKPISKKTYRNISTETGSKSKSMNWSDLENFNLTVEKSAKKSYPVLHDLENHMKSLSATSHNRNDKDLSSNSRPFQISSLHSKHASDESNVLEQYNEPNNNYDTACDNDQYNDSSERYNYRDNHDISDYHEDMHEMRRNGKRKSTNTYITSDEVATLKSLAKSTTLVPQSVETCDSLHKERGSEHSQSLPPEDECYSQFDTNENIPFKDFGNETKGKQLHLQRFLECAVRYSESQKSSSLPNVNSSLDHSRDNAESAKSHETVNEVITSKSDELQMSRTRWKNEKHKYSTDIDTLKKTTVEDLVKENSKYFKDCTIDELTLRKSVDLVPQEDKSVKSFEMKRKKTYCGSEEKMVERHQKKSKLNENLTLLKNCTIDSLTLMHSSGHSGDEKSSKNMDNYGFTNKISRKDRDFRNSELNRSRSLTKKSALKSNSILNNSRLSTVSFKETEADNNWFSRITFQLSQDADTMARRLLATVQKCFYDFSTKMCFLRENIIKTTETFEMSSVQNVNISKLKNLIQTCRVIRAEVEKSLKAMEMTGKEYFETEEKHYRKLRHKYIKACKKYMSSMENAKKNAIHNLEGNVILKAKNFFRKFLKYMDTA